MLSENIYALRRRMGLTQEQLAEALGVSRQAISKWESGTAMPESEKLIALAQYFDVSLDELVGMVTATENADAVLPSMQTMSASNESSPNARAWIAGVVLCVMGVIALIVWGVITMLSPELSDRVQASSTVTLDGNGLLLLCCLVLLCLGALVILKRNRK